MILCARCDVSLVGEVDAAVSQVRQSSPIQGLLHASGILHDAVIGQQSADLVRKVYAPKSMGAMHLLKVSDKHICSFKDSQCLSSGVAQTKGMRSIR